MMISHSKPSLGMEEKNACLAVLDSQYIAQGQKVEQLERDFCRFTGRRYGVAVSSGTSGLILSLYALGISRGDEVIVPSYACAALLHAIRGVQATAVPADIDLEDFNLPAAEIKKRITSKTKAVIFPHAFGLPGNIPEIAKLGIPIIEDGTQALGATVHKTPVGKMGILSVFSFYATKMITTGEGGMILTDSRALAQKLRDARDYDKKKTYGFHTNSKMTDLEAAIGIEQLKKLPQFIQRRRQIAARYRDAFQSEAFILPQDIPQRNHVYYRYILRVPSSINFWIKSLNDQGVDAKKPVFKPVHQYLNKSDKAFPKSRQAMQEACSLPIYPSLTDGDVERVIEKVRLTAKRFQKIKKTEMALR